MNSRERVLMTLSHKEPDRVPFDISGTNVSGIAVKTYRQLLSYYEMDEDVRLQDIIQQLAQPSDHFLEFWNVDTIGLIPRYYASIPLAKPDWEKTHIRKNDGYEYTDEWGIKYLFREKEDYYYSQLSPLLPDTELSQKDVEDLQFPEADAEWRFEGLKESGKKYIQEGKAVLLKTVNAGFQETCVKIRGMQNFLMDLYLNRSAVETLLDRILEYKLTYWKKAIAHMEGSFDIAVEADDYGTQESLLFSPEIFRELIKPRLKILFDFIHKEASACKVFFHSCGAIKPLIPDFIEIGVDVLNPIHVAAREMDPLQIKNEFGRDIVLWGGGVETQNILPNGSVSDVIENVTQNIEVFAKDGGWVFSPIHNIQAHVPVENLDAMQRTLMEKGIYKIGKIRR